MPGVTRGGWRSVAVPVVLGTVLGVASAVLSVRVLSHRGAIQRGAWATSVTLGGAQAGLYERAEVAVHALFVLNRSETVYFRADTDDRGQPLSSRCDYVIRGRPPEARWWSITAYGADDFLIRNAPGRYSFHQGNMALEPDGSFVLRASPRTQPGNWLPLGDHPGRVSLTFRLYNPSPRIAADPGTFVPPTITGRCP